MDIDNLRNRYVAVSYKLFTVDTDGSEELVERAPKEEPFSFVSGMGVALDAFEKKIVSLQCGENFDFILSVSEGYGTRESERVIEVRRDVFTVNGHFDNKRIFAGSVVPLMNEEGARFNGTVVKVGNETVTLDLNHPLADKKLHFVGCIEENREATNDEIRGILNMLRGDGCSCGCEHEHCGGNCSHHEEGCECGCC